MATPPSLAPNARRRGLCFLYGDAPLPRSKREMEGFLCFFYGDTPLPHSKCEMKGSLLCFQHHYPACKPLLMGRDEVLTERNNKGGMTGSHTNPDDRCVLISY